MLGCRILGVYTQPEHLHFLLDIPYLWSVDADGSMALVQDEEAIRGLDAPEAVADALLAEAEALREAGVEAAVAHFIHPPRDIGAIEDATLYTTGSETHLRIVGDAGDLSVAWQDGAIRLLES